MTKTIEERVEEVYRELTRKTDPTAPSEYKPTTRREILRQALKEAEQRGVERNMDFIRKETDLYCKGKNLSTEVRVLILDAVKKKNEDNLSSILNEIKDCNCEQCRKLEIRVLEALYQK